MMFNTIDDGFSHESKIESKGLSCPPLSGFNHLAVFLDGLTERDWSKKKFSD